MKKNLLLLVFTIIFFFLQFSAANSTKTNFAILDSIASSAIQTIYKNCSNSDTIFYKIIPEENDWFIEKKLLELKENRVLINANNISDIQNSQMKFGVKIAIEDFSTKFEQIENHSDSVKRTCTLVLNVIKNYSDKQSETFNVALTHKDTLYFDALQNLNHSSFQFANSSIPTKKRSLFVRIIEPALIVATVALTTILFFTVRSK